MNMNAETTLQAYLALDPSQRVIFNAARLALEGAAPVATMAEHCPPREVSPLARAGATDIPRLYGPAVDPDVFTSAQFKSLATRNTAIVYFAGCDGLYGLSQDITKGSYKLGLSAAHSVQARMMTLAEDLYGSAWLCGGLIRKDDGFDHWKAASLVTTEDRPRNSPVEPERRFIRVRLPAGLTSGMLDKALAASLADRSLSAYGTSPDDMAHCAGIGFDARRLIRYTPARQAGQRPKAATELVHVSPRRDADALAGLLEAIVARVVMRKAP